MNASVVVPHQAMTTAAVRRGSRAMSAPAVNPIRALRLKACWSVGALAAAAGLSPTTVRRVEAGRQPSQQTLQRIGRALGLDLAAEFARCLDASSSPAEPTSAPTCEWCAGPVGRPYADGRPRRYCSRSCDVAATEAWHRYVNRRYRQSALLAPSCRLPGAERRVALADVEAELAELAARLRIVSIGHAGPLPGGGGGRKLHALEDGSTSSWPCANGREIHRFGPKGET